MKHPTTTFSAARTGCRQQADDDRARVVWGRVMDRANRPNHPAGPAESRKAGHE